MKRSLRRSSSTLVVVGDCLLDRDLEGRVERLSPDAPVPLVEDLRERPRPGGAGLAACLAAHDGRQVRLVTALARDPAGEQLRALLEDAGVEVIDLGLEAATPEKVRVRSAGQTLLRFDQGGKRPALVGPPAPEVDRALADAAGVLVSDYGWGVTAQASLRGSLARAAAAGPLLWDPHPLGAAPVPAARLVKPNRREAGAGRELGDVTRRAQALRREWQARAVVVTLGEEGALLVTGEGAPLVAPAPRLSVLDPCGAGDRFSSTAAGLLADGASAEEAVTAAVSAASAFVAAGGASAAHSAQEPPAAALEGMEAAIAVAQGTRAAGGRVVATGGCFDLLHAGHVSVLQAARRLGGCLIVLLNSDQSVRRLKGSDRPLVDEADRAAVIGALECVDAVAIFDEATPEAALRRLRPDVFAKGGDYAGIELPERALLAEWGAEVVILPYLKGRSTSRLVEELIRES
ncbi:MAG: D-beta-D-heptose 1-phosphate adenosyltransferase [Candidatus Nephthysia bennettiae]|nr:bifunctional heptose 7-phosphate kinase/heptose 1-phosphate adenyltransferase [Candidatus Dormibacteraeota bacterium]PZR88145.1 MAG: D-beta-D-heptose 1-phosphate adenosyltransferase [Candidatus Dormibacteraeota bacterium]